MRPIHLVLLPRRRRRRATEPQPRQQIRQTLTQPPQQRILTELRMVAIPVRHHLGPHHRLSTRRLPKLHHLRPLLRRLSPPHRVSVSDHRIPRFRGFRLDPQRMAKKSKSLWLMNRLQLLLVVVRWWIRRTPNLRTWTTFRSCPKMMRVGQIRLKIRPAIPSGATSPWRTCRKTSHLQSKIS